MINTAELPFVTSSILTSNAYYNDYPVDVTRVTLNTQYSFASGSSGEWRQHTFQFTINQPYYPTYTLSFTANSQYGDNYLKWVSLYDSDYRLVYSSGWVDTIDNVVVPSPFQEGENSGTVHVYERVMREDHTAPPQNEMNSTMFVFRGQFRDVVTQPQGWNETTTVTYTTATQIIPELTTGTSVTIAATPQRLISHERFFLAVLDKLWELPDLMWLTVACLVLVFCAWLLL